MDGKKYRLDVNLHPRDEMPIFNTEEVTLRERLMAGLFGKKRRYLIIVPSEAIESLSFNEVSVADDDECASTHGLRTRF